MPVPVSGPVRIAAKGSEEMEKEKEMALQDETRVLRRKMSRGGTTYFLDLDGVRSR